MKLKLDEVFNPYILKRIHPDKKVPHSISYAVYPRLTSETLNGGEEKLDIERFCVVYELVSYSNGYAVYKYGGAE